MEEGGERGDGSGGDTEAVWVVGIWVLAHEATEGGEYVGGISRGGLRFGVNERYLVAADEGGEKEDEEGYKHGLCGEDAGITW